jgi:hypothetical protein
VVQLRNTRPLSPLRPRSTTRTNRTGSVLLA